MEMFGVLCVMHGHREHLPKSCAYALIWRECKALKYDYNSSHIWSWSDSWNTYRNLLRAWGNTFAR